MRGWQGNRPPDGPFELNYSSPQSDGLVGWWPFLDSRGIYLVRDLCNGFDGAVLGNPIWTPTTGRGYSLKFDGTGDYVQVIKNSVLEPASALTICAWIRTSSTAGPSGIIEHLRTGIGGAGTAGYMLSVDPSNYLRFDFMGDNKIASYGLETGNWEQVIGRWNGLTFQALVNGGAVKSTTGEKAASYSAANIMFGYDQYSTARMFTGELSDIRIYETWKSDDECWAMWDPLTRWDLYLPIRRYWHIAKSPAAIGNPYYAYAQQ